MQSKIGFGTPEDDWIRTLIFKDFVESVLHSNKFKTCAYINAEIAMKLYSKHLTGKINISQEIWKWINLNEWLTLLK